MPETKIYKDTDNFIVLKELKDLSKSANSFLDGTATVTISLETTNGTTVTGQTFPASMTYNSTKARGTFEGTLDSVLALTLWKHYDLIIAISGSGIPTRSSKKRLFVTDGLFEE